MFSSFANFGSPKQVYFLDSSVEIVLSVFFKNTTTHDSSEIELGISKFSITNSTLYHLESAACMDSINLY